MPLAREVEVWARDVSFLKGSLRVAVLNSNLLSWILEIQRLRDGSWRMEEETLRVP